MALAFFSFKVMLAIKEIDEEQFGATAANERERERRRLRS